MLGTILGIASPLALFAPAPTAAAVPAGHAPPRGYTEPLFRPPARRIEEPLQATRRRGERA